MRPRFTRSLNQDHHVASIAGGTILSYVAFWGAFHVLECGLSPKAILPLLVSLLPFPFYALLCVIVPLSIAHHLVVWWMLRPIRSATMIIWIPLLSGTGLAAVLMVMLLDHLMNASHPASAVDPLNRHLIWAMAVSLASLMVSQVAVMWCRAASSAKREAAEQSSQATAASRLDSEQAR